MARSPTRRPGTAGKPPRCLLAPAYPPVSFKRLALESRAQSVPVLEPASSTSRPATPPSALPVTASRQRDRVRTGYGQAGLVGSGARAGEHFRTGYGVAGLVGVGVSESVFVEAGYGTVGAVGSGTSSAIVGGNEYVKAGFAVAGLVGIGVSSSITDETGAAIVGTVGAGSSASVVDKTGFGRVGQPGPNIYGLLGYGAVGLVGSGDSDVRLGWWCRIRQGWLCGGRARRCGRELASSRELASGLPAGRCRHERLRLQESGTA